MGSGEFTVEVRKDFIHVHLAPAFEISLNSIRQLWTAVVPACEQHALNRVLIEGDSPTRSMRTDEAYQHGRIVADLDLDGMRVAFCLHDYEPDELSYLFTTVANSSFNEARFFNQVEDAMNFLGQ